MTQLWPRQTCQNHILHKISDELNADICIIGGDGDVGVKWHYSFVKFGRVHEGFLNFQTQTPAASEQKPALTTLGNEVVTQLKCKASEAVSAEQQKTIAVEEEKLMDTLQMHDFFKTPLGQKKDSRIEQMVPAQMEYFSQTPLDQMKDLGTE